MRAAFLLLLAMLAFPTLVQAAGEISAVGTSATSWTDPQLVCFEVHCGQPRHARGMAEFDPLRKWSRIAEPLKP